MILFVDRLPEEGREVKQQFEYSNTELVDGSAVFLEPLSVELKVKKIGTEVQIKGTMKTSFYLECSRCLVPFDFFVDSKFDIVYFPEELGALKEELQESDMNDFYYQDRKIDLREVALEQLNLTFPQKPLCSEKCQGICPVCGKNQKHGKCSCVVEESDPRLQKFKIFMKDRQ